MSNDRPRIQHETTGFLLVGHGTRSSVGQSQLRVVHQQFASNLSPQPTELGFLELAEPTIAEACARLARRGATQMVAVPVLLFAAGHALHDIPQALEEASRRVGIRLLGQTSPLESHPSLVDLSARRFRQSACLGSEGQLLCGQFCQRTHCPQVGLAMIGRGSQSPAATEKMKLFSQLRRELTPVAWMNTGFVYAQSPTVDEVLDELAAASLPLSIVQPHLLFEGDLLDSIRSKVEAFALKYPQSTWITAAPLGVDPSLAQALSQLALELEKSTTLPATNRIIE
jgi:sirohydrochlorin cobaltochelatase